MTHPSLPSRGAAALKKFEQLLNPCISFSVVLAAVIGCIGLPGVGREGVAALQAATHVPAAGLVALILFPLLYPVVDVANWAQLVTDQNEVTAAVLPLLLVCVCAIALSTMISIFSASLCAIRYDILPWLWPKLSAGVAQAADEAVAVRRARIAAIGFLVASAASFLIFETAPRINVSSSAFLALLFALGSAQLAFLPLVLGPVMARMNGGAGIVSPNWALAIMGCGALGGAAAAAIYAATGQETWLWAVVPACLGAGLLAFCMARLWPAKP